MSAVTLSEATAAIMGAPEVTRADVAEHGTSTLLAVGLANFLKAVFPPRELLLAPWLPTQGLAMLYGPRGVGKTYLTLSAAFAIASSGSALGWRAARPAGVLYIDGEMPGVVLQERLAAIVASSDTGLSAPLDVLTPDLQAAGMPDLATIEGQAAVDSTLTDDHRLIIVDSISTLIRTGKENEADSWLPAQGWALRHRAAGRSVLFVHHAGKGGAQRGTSRREDVLDTVIALRRPRDYDPKKGASFEVHYEKARGFYGEDAAPFEATLAKDERGQMAWTTRTVEESSFSKVVALTKDNYAPGEIADELGIHKSRVSHHLNRARKEGLI